MRDAGQEEVQAGVKPNPYEGILTAGGPTPAEYDKSAELDVLRRDLQEVHGEEAAPKPTR